MFKIEIIKFNSYNNRTWIVQFVAKNLTKARI